MDQPNDMAMVKTRGIVRVQVSGLPAFQIQRSPDFAGSELKFCSDHLSTI